MTERYWYQDGWTISFVLGIAAFIGFVYLKIAEESESHVIPTTVAGSINQPLSGQPSLIVSIWHSLLETSGTLG